MIRLPTMRRLDVFGCPDAHKVLDAMERELEEAKYHAASSWDGGTRIKAKLRRLRKRRDEWLAS